MSLKSRVRAPRKGVLTDVCDVSADSEEPLSLPCTLQAEYKLLRSLVCCLKKHYWLKSSNLRAVELEGGIVETTGESTYISSL